MCTTCPAGWYTPPGGGILLYEIQQSSDVTYRLWDFDRVNAAGEKRPLHIRQSLDVIVPELTGQIAHMPENDGCGLVTLLDVPAFHLECANVNGECELAPQPHAFRMLTALAGLLLSWQGDAIELKAGDSVLLPASCPPVTLMGVGQALISTPARRVPDRAGVFRHTKEESGHEGLLKGGPPPRRASATR